MCRNIHRPFVRGQAGNNVQTGLVHSTLGFLGVLERYTDLIAKFRPFVFLKLRYGLVEVVFEEVQKGIIVILGDSGVV
jgi:hypothetical protein